MKISEADTKTLILDAAEQAFADLGFDAASLRHIISLAGVNLAAVHYHFGSKEALIEAVFARRIQPLTQERMRLLDAIQVSKGQPLPLEKVLEALVGPALRLARGPGGPVVMRLFGRLLAEPSESMQRMMGNLFGETMTRFSQAFQRALPSLPQPVLMWRIQFAIGSMGHLMCDPQDLKMLSGGHCDPSDTESAVAQLVEFLVAGFNAPAPRRERAR